MPWLLAVKPKDFEKHCRKCEYCGKIFHEPDPDGDNWAVIDCNRPIDMDNCPKGVKEYR